jgi:hypothetical protein
LVETQRRRERDEEREAALLEGASALANVDSGAPYTKAVASAAARAGFVDPLAYARATATQFSAETAAAAAAAAAVEAAVDKDVGDDDATAVAAAAAFGREFVATAQRERDYVYNYDLDGVDHNG